MKVRTQVQLDPADHAALERWARARGVSMSGAVRWLIREHLMPRPAGDTRSAFLRAAGAVKSALADEGRAGEEHDRVLYGSPDEE